MDILSFLPLRIRKKVETDSELSPSCERKSVTVFFADVSGFTALSERREPEKVTDIINLFFQNMWDIVKRHHGDVENFLGDALLVIFDGKDKEQRACKCALQMQEEMANFKKWQFGMTIGMASGYVLFFLLGNARRMKHTLLGKTLNRAEFLEKMATKGQILIDQATYLRVTEDFLFEKPKTKKIFHNQEQVAELIGENK